ncbi:MAG: hydroxymethylglutaryl-CoA lyase [Cytophaga sp.]|nr:hydroxymethylglutaryl-CoA lyase [Cytophaga sp.]
MKIIECPRDAMQGIDEFIPTDKKVAYLNQLLQVGFDTIDFGSFVSAKVIPQLKDTVEVLNRLDLSTTKSKLLAIVANTRGAQEASAHEAITYLGFPLSISETFQVRNTNKTIAEALNTVDEIQNVCIRTGKTLVTYISMGFGNPYGDRYDLDLVTQFVGILDALHINIISLSDTIGVSQPDQLKHLFGSLTKQYPHMEFGAHLHSHPATALKKIEAAFASGCQRFDGALKGFGGCPLAEDELVGNLATETLISFLDKQEVVLNLNRAALQKSMALAEVTFPNH